MHLILHDECGLAGKAPHLVRGQSWIFAESDVSGTLSERTVAFDPMAVQLRYQGLDSGAEYAIRVTYATERSGGHSQKLTANGVLVHDVLELPRGRAGAYEFALPPRTVRGGSLLLEFHRVTGPNAVVSEVELWSSKEQRFLSANASIDDAGLLTVAAIDGVGYPVQGAAVTISSASLAAAHSLGETDAAGRVEWRLPPNLRALPAARFALRVSRWGQAVDTVALYAPFRAPTPYVPKPRWVAGVRTPVLRLDGAWRFNPNPPDRFWQGPERGRWSPIRVPAEWALQGFTVPASTEAAYFRTFTLPADWRGKRVVLHFNGVFCDARVWVNGRLVAEHRGGFTPFEADVAAALARGPNRLVVGVRDETITNTLSKGSQYAFHRIGGILRSVYLIALPAAHLSALHVQTDLDHTYRDAVLRVRLTAAGVRCRVRFSLADSSGRPVRLDSPVLACGADAEASRGFPVRGPRLWNAEQPFLYTLTADVYGTSGLSERVVKRLGFREVKVKGGRLLVNGRPVKLRGVCRHEVHPDMGRAVTGLWRTDARLFKEANVNYVRTSHYPPAEEFVEACDEIGLYVLEEAPLIWVDASQSADRSLRSYFLSPAAEMVDRDRDHPSVIMWSLANESTWGPNFEDERRLIARTDPTRPILFCGAHGPENVLPIESSHYPAPSIRWSGPRPILFTEYCHINCYNKEELKLDPGVRDYYGRYLREFQDDFDAQPGIVGGSIWAGIDEMFDLPSGRTGYGEWGIIDGYRRRKPEWWHVKKAYSPVRVESTALPVPPSGIPAVRIRNRFDFTDVKEVSVRWRLAHLTGIARCSARPGSVGLLRIPVRVRDGDALDLAFVRIGSTIDSERIRFGREPAHPVPVPAGPVTVRGDGSSIEVAGLGTVLIIDPGTGLVSEWRAYRPGPPPSGAQGRHTKQIPPSERRREGGVALRHRATPPSRRRPAQLTASTPVFAAAGRGAGGVGGPFLSVVTLGDMAQLPEAESWKLESLETRTLTGGIAEMTAHGEYPGAKGFFRYTIGGNGIVRISGEFEARPGRTLNPKEWGIVFKLPAGFDRLSWDRRGIWSVYPPDHIGRLHGEARAVERGDHWSALPGEGGCNDFRSTKYNIFRASLSDPAGRQVTVRSDGSASVRAYRRPNGTELRVNAYANGGGEGFLDSSAQKDRRPITDGARLSFFFSFSFDRPSHASAARPRARIRLDSLPGKAYSALQIGKAQVDSLPSRKELPV